MEGQNKLEYVSLASLYSVVQYMRIMQGVYPILEQLKGVPRLFPSPSFAAE